MATATGSSLDPDDSAAAEPTRAERRAEARAEKRAAAATHAEEDPAHAKFGGLNLGASFFGWIVAIGVTLLLVGVVGAIAAAVNDQTELTFGDLGLSSDVETVGIVSLAVAVGVLALGYYVGGYVAGRMSRFDGARQGAGVWFIGLLVTIAAGVVGAIAGEQYNVLDRIDLPQLSFADVGPAAIGTGLVVLLVTLLAAMLGGKVGRRYHARVDRALAATP